VVQQFRYRSALGADDPLVELAVGVPLHAGYLPIFKKYVDATGAAAHALAEGLDDLSQTIASPLQ